MKTHQSGFTLIELLMVVAIIGILGTVALPAYQNYTLKSRFAQVAVAFESYKTSIELCAAGSLTDASCVAANGTDFNGIAIVNGVRNALAVTAQLPDTAPDSGLFVGAGVNVSVGGNVVTVAFTPRAQFGASVADTYVQTGTRTPDGRITWALSGGCTTRASGRIC